ncbi:PspC domain-containing protein [Leucobacter luti]|uniref:PspC domain-containing protein n=1 Tax=Leucobacter luti TaxID=340320 RepID=UPI003CFD17AE
MNEQSPPQESPAHGGDGFFAWIRGLGIIRSSDRWFAGVAGGIAARAGIDPLIVRGLFVVLALLGGPGILLYIAGWLLLPDASGRIHVQEVLRGRAETGVVVATVIGAIVLVGAILTPVTLGFSGPRLGLPWFGDWPGGLFALLGFPTWLSSTLTWLFWVAVVVAGFIVVRRAIIRRGRERGAGSTAADPNPVDEPATGAATTASYAADRPQSQPQPGPMPQPQPDAPPHPPSCAEQADDWGRRAGEKASEWGADAGRKADEWSARYAEHHDARRLGAAHVILTLAGALLAAAAGAAWALGPGGTDPALPALLAAVAALAVSLIIVGIRGKNSGWIGFLSACGVIAIAVTAVFPWGSSYRLFGNVSTTDTSTPGIVMVAGNISLDLRDLDTPRIGENAEGTSVWQFAGNVRITLPEEHPTVVQVRILAGRVGERVSGPFISETFSNLPRGASEKEKSGATRITIFQFAGNTTVRTADPESSGRSSTDSLERQSSEAQLSDAKEELERVQWQLTEPGIDSADRKDLRSERDDLRDEIAQLEKELAR